MCIMDEKNMSSSVSLKELVACIITFNPDLEGLWYNICRIRHQVCQLIVVDNGSDCIDSVRSICMDENFILVENSENKGIAKALNQGFMEAEKLGYSWVLTLDQDSICEQNMVERLCSFIESSGIGIVCPQVIFQVKDVVVHKTNTLSPVGDTLEACITSGSLTKLSAWKKVNGFDEWMFIDHVDNDFCMRLRLNGFRIVRNNEAVLYQRAGEMAVKKRKTGKEIMITNYSPLRNYYMVRNHVYYIKKYRGSVSISKEIARIIYIQIKKIFYEKKRVKTIVSAFQGAIDGITETVPHYYERVNK